MLTQRRAMALAHRAITKGTARPLVIRPAERVAGVGRVAFGTRPAATAGVTT